MNAAVWLEVEYAGLDGDLGHWLALADGAAGPVVDAGAGIGRVTLPLARAGHEVIALERDDSSVAELRTRAAAEGLTFDSARQDIRELWLPRKVPLIIVPGNSVQMIGPGRDRACFLARAAAWLTGGGRLAVSFIDPFGGSEPADRADELVRDGHRYRSRYLGQRRSREGIELLRERQIDDGPPAYHVDVMWWMTPKLMLAEAAWHGFALERAGLLASEGYEPTFAMTFTC